MKQPSSTISPAARSTRRRVVVTAIGLGVFALAVTVSTGIVQFVRTIDIAARGLASNESRLARAAFGSVVTLGDDTVGVLVDVVGARGLTRESDSLFVFRGHAIDDAGTAIPEGPHVVAVMEPVKDWTFPIHLRLTDRRRLPDGSFRQGRLVLDGISRVFDVIVSGPAQDSAQ